MTYYVDDGRKPNLTIFEALGMVENLPASIYLQFEIQGEKIAVVKKDIYPCEIYVSVLPGVTLYKEKDINSDSRVSSNREKAVITGIDGSEWYKLMTDDGKERWI